MRIAYYPHECLRWACKPVVEFNDEVIKVARAMQQHLLKIPMGVALAAPQVQFPYRIFIVRAWRKTPDQVFINPTIELLGEKTKDDIEGCLSIPHHHYNVNRHHKVRITAFNEHGEKFSLTSSGMRARIWQHELDHLDGILILDRGDLV